MLCIGECVCHNKFVRVSAILHWLGDIECSNEILNYCFPTPVTFSQPTLTPPLFEPSILLCSPPYFSPSLQNCRHLLSSVLLPSCFSHPLPLQYFILTSTSWPWIFLLHSHSFKSHLSPDLITFYHNFIFLSLFTFLFLCQRDLMYVLWMPSYELTVFKTFLMLVQVNITWNGPLVVIKEASRSHEWKISMICYLVLRSSSWRTFCAVAFKSASVLIVCVCVCVCVCVYLCAKLHKSHNYFVDWRRRCTYDLIWNDRKDIKKE